jgi:hypothetical protein
VRQNTLVLHPPALSAPVVTAPLQGPLGPPMIIPPVENVPVMSAPVELVPLQGPLGPPVP